MIGVVVIPELATSHDHRIIAVFLDEVDQTIKTSEVYLQLKTNHHVCTCDTDEMCRHIEYTLELIGTHKENWDVECVATLPLMDDVDPYEAARALVEASVDPKAYRDQVLRFAKVIQL